MGRIKELQEKQKQGSITEEELKELNELIAESKEMAETLEDEDKALDDLADKLAESAFEKAESRLSAGLEDILKGLQTKSDDSVKVTKEAKFIVDARLGKKTVEELDQIKVAVPGRTDKQYKEVTMKTVHFLSALMTGDVQKLQVLVEGTTTLGGFLVPDEYANMIVEDIRDLSVMRQIADVMTTTSDTLHLPNLASRPKAAWRSEGAVKQTSTVQWGENVFTPYSLATIVPLSNELVADAQLGVSGNVVNYVAQLMARSLAEKEETAFWTGSGSGQPTGVSTYSIGTMSGGITDASRSDAVIQTWIRLPQGYRNRAVFVANAATLERVFTLKDSQGNYLVSRLNESPVFTLKGRPLYEQNDIAPGTLYFGDFSYYKIVDREGITVRVSDEATVASQSAFERNLTFIRVEKRVDGELTLTQAIRSATSMGNP